MSPLVLICPYFGKLPNYFPLTLLSMKNNSQITWLIFTDDRTEYNYPPNVQIKYVDFDEIKQLIKENLDIDASGIKPYKLCDYRPFYGIIFQEYIREYDFWGHCDFDCIFGNLFNFISDDIFNRYEKILYLGHLSLYKNDEKMRNLILSFKEAVPDAEKKLQQDYPYQFDEVLITQYLLQEKLPIYIDDDNIADIYCLKKPFYITKSQVQTDVVNRRIYLKSSFIPNNGLIFSYHNGKLQGIFLDEHGEIRKKEYMYLHLQKRPMDYQESLFQSVDSFLILPNFFSPYKYVDKKMIHKYRQDVFFYGNFARIKWKNLKNRFKRMKIKIGQ